MYSVLITAAIASVAMGEVEIDCSKLPEPETVGLRKYTFRVTLRTASGECEFQEAHMDTGNVGAPLTGVLITQAGFKWEGWDTRVDGLKLYVSGGKLPDRA